VSLRATVTTINGNRLCITIASFSYIVIKYRVYNGSSKTK